MSISDDRKDFFISHATEDGQWAKWIAVTLEQHGYTTYSQIMDFRPGYSFTTLMARLIDQSDRMIVLLSPAYLKSTYAKAEWQSRWIEDHLGEDGQILPVLIEPCKTPRFLTDRIRINLSNAQQEEAKAKLLSGVKRDRPRLTSAVFPGRSSGTQPERSEGASVPFPGQSSHTTPRSQPWSAPSSRLINYEKARTELHSLLTSAERHGVIVVQGQAGTGKSILADTVLSELPGTAADPSRVPIHRHPLSPGMRLSVSTLVEDIEGSVDVSHHHRSPRRSLGRLEVAVEALRDAPVVIVIDSAEQLLAPETGQMIDRDLDEALEMLTTTSGHRVAVVLITQLAPVSEGGNTWPGSAHTVRVDGLPLDCFAEYLRRIQTGAGEPSFPDTEIAAYHRRLRGNPRLAEIAAYLVTDMASRFTAETLLERLNAVPEKDVPRILVELMCATLDVTVQHVLRALAAFGTPIDDAAVSELAASGHAPAKTKVVLEKLCSRAIIRRTPDGRYYLPASDIDRTLLSLQGQRGERAELLSRAAYILSQRRKPLDEIHTLADLDVHFAELRLRLRAETYGSAYELIQQLDDILRPWNCGGLLAGSREFVRTRLDSDFLEMDNHNALGDTYVYRGMFESASDSFGKALRLAPTAGAPDAERKVLANVATMLFEQNNTEKAHDAYSSVLREAQAQDNVEDQMAAWEGLADCHRRWGGYEQAIALARNALSAAHETRSDRAVDIALKLARWYGETGRPQDADRLIEAAFLEATERRDAALLAWCHEGRADFYLGRAQHGADPQNSHAQSARQSEDIRRATQAAENAIELALKYHDPVTLRQARTTLCLVYLTLNDLVRARREIEAALRHRRKGKSLEGLALCGLVLLGCHDAMRAREVFAELCDEAKQQALLDPRDFAALEFFGFGVCGTAVLADEPASEAVLALRKAREMVVPAAPGLVNRYEFMINYLRRFGEHSHRLQPVVDALSTATDHPHRTESIPAPAPG